MLAFAFGPIDAIGLVAFRTLLTVALFAYVATWWRDADEWLTAVGFHPSAEIVGGMRAALPLVPQAALPGLAILYFGAMALVVLGKATRPALAVVLGCLLYTTLVDRLAAFSANKIYLASYAVLLAAPAVDEGGRLRSAWPVRVLQATLLAQYFGAGLCKLAYGTWGTHTDSLFMVAQLEYMTDAAAWLVRELPLTGWRALHVSTLAFELLAPVLFVVPSRAVRTVAFVWGALMHVAIGVLMFRVGFFAAQSLAFYALFAPPEWLHAVRRRLVPASSAA
jgi:hypothetical protein